MIETCKALVKDEGTLVELSESRKNQNKLVTERVGKIKELVPEVDITCGIKKFDGEIELIQFIDKEGVSDTKVPGPTFMENESVSKRFEKFNGFAKAAKNQSNKLGKLELKSLVHAEKWDKPSVLSRTSQNLGYCWKIDYLGGFKNYDLEEGEIE
uniref:PAP_fibrillin domain-containing protein n=1 Tax=Rhabditophanes sp. KR3021 TaxID=114890 RepID=A0AC35U5Y0_9BILA